MVDFTVLHVNSNERKPAKTGVVLIVLLCAYCLGLEPKQNYDCLVLAATVGYPVLESDWPWSTIKTLALESRCKLFV